MDTNNFYDRQDFRQMLKSSNVDYQFDKNEHGIIYANGIRQTFDQAREIFKQSLPSVAFAYKGFWCEAEPFDQTENGYPEDGFTYTSYVWHSREERESLEDQIDELNEVYDSPEELEEGVKKAIDRYIKKQNKKEAIKK